MLAQNFKSANDLNLTEREWTALVQTLKLLETGQIVHVPTPNRIAPHQSRRFTGHFNMCDWNTTDRCGTIGCIGGTAELVAGFRRGHLNEKAIDDVSLHELFYPTLIEDWNSITTAQAAMALRCYLTSGEVDWVLAIS